MSAGHNAGAMHILVLGQSNVANHGDMPANSEWGRVWHRGSFSSLSDPLPGGTGRGGSVWTRFAPLLRESGAVDDFVVTICAKGGTSMSDWSLGGKCYDSLLEALPLIEVCPARVTHILYHQGERDTLLGTQGADYVDLFRPLHALLRRQFPDAPIMVCTASYRMGVISEDVRAAQSEIQTSLAGCVAGPDTDGLGADFRHDDTHFNQDGLEAFAKSLLDAFQPLIAP